MSDKQVVIIGGGPAGLTAAYELTKRGVAPVVLEKRDRVGGIARTENYKGYYFDMGGHRFYSKAEAANNMWQEVLGNDFLKRPRLSRIYYNSKFFNYPLKPLNALFGLGIFQAILVVLSYIRWQIFPYKQENTFEEWVTNRFGQKLFLTFFKSYTEKVWGRSTSELKAEWAAQRIKDLSLRSALTTMFVKPQKTITSLIDEFQYPRRGPGMLWNKVKEQVECQQGVVRLNTDVVRICRTGNRIHSVMVRNEHGEEEIRGTDFISSMPIADFIKRLDPAPPEVLEAAKKLSYRDFLTVCLIVNQPDLFPDNWIYVHSPEVKVGRVQNFKNWSPEMVPDQSKSSLGLEYFCNEGDELWTMANADLIELGKREIDCIGLAKYKDVEDGVVFRVEKTYPVYDSDYHEYLDVIRQFMAGLENFQTIGRNGLHRYDNQDHAMVTGMLAVRNLLNGEKNDVWAVNTDAEYQEEVRAEVKPDVAQVFRGKLQEVFSRVDPVAFGLSTALATGLGAFLITLMSTFENDALLNTNLQPLNEFFVGYSVSIPGSFVALFYAALIGFAGGWAFGFLRNLSVYLSALIIRRDIEMTLLRKFLDYM